MTTDAELFGLMDLELEDDTTQPSDDDLFAEMDLELEGVEPAEPVQSPGVGLDEGKFQEWYASKAEKHDLASDPDDPKHFYDYRAAYKAGAQPDESGHWPSEFKSAGHPNLVIGGVDTRTGRPVGQEALPTAFQEYNVAQQEQPTETPMFEAERPTEFVQRGEGFVEEKVPISTGNLKDLVSNAKSSFDQANVLKNVSAEQAELVIKELPIKQQREVSAKLLKIKQAAPKFGEAVRTVGALTKLGGEIAFPIKDPYTPDEIAGQGFVTLVKEKEVPKSAKEMKAIADEYRDKEGKIPLNPNLKGAQYNKQKLSSFLQAVKRWEENPERQEKVKEVGEKLIVDANEIFDPLDYKAYEIDKRIETLKNNQSPYWSALERGDLGFVLDQATSDSFFSGNKEEIERFLELKEKFKKDSARPEEERKGLLKNTYISLLEMLVPMGKTAPKVMVPGVGGLWAGYEWGRQGMGEVAGELYKAGVPIEDATKIGAVTGVLYAAVEQLQVKQLTNIPKAGIKKGVKAYALKMLEEKGKDWIKEVGEEGLQKAFVDIGIEYGKRNAGVSDKTIMEALKETATNTIKEMGHASLPMAVLSLAGLGGGMARAGIEGDFKGPSTQASEEQITEPTPVTPEEDFKPDEYLKEEEIIEEPTADKPTTEEDVLTPEEIQEIETGLETEELAEEKEAVPLKDETFGETTVALPKEKSHLKESVPLTPDQLKAKKGTGTLYGIPNRASFDTEIKEEYDRLRTGETEDLSIAIIDTHNQSRMNDIYGHEGTDKILREIGKIEKKHIDKLTSGDKEAILYRTGGDERTIKAKNITKEELSKALDAMSQEIDGFVSEKSFKNEKGGTSKLSDLIHLKNDRMKSGAGNVNVGVASWKDIDSNAENPIVSMMEVADRESFQKGSDRNREQALKEFVDSDRPFVYNIGTGKYEKESSVLAEVIQENKKSWDTDSYKELKSLAENEMEKRGTYERIRPGTEQRETLPDIRESLTEGTRPTEKETAPTKGRAVKEAVSEVVPPKAEKPAPKPTQKPKFKKWFSESKAVDENQEPIVMYHGTDGPIDIIEPGYDEPGAWFTNRKTASNYAKGLEGVVYPVYLSAKKPLVVTFNSEMIPIAEGKELDFESNVEIVEYAEKEGYDSVNFPDGNFSEDDNTWVVFDSDQIKKVEDLEREEKPTQKPIEAVKKTQEIRRDLIGEYAAIQESKATKSEKLKSEHDKIELGSNIRRRISKSIKGDQWLHLIGQKNKDNSGKLITRNKATEKVLQKVVDGWNSEEFMDRNDWHTDDVKDVISEGLNMKDFVKYHQEHKDKLEGIKAEAKKGEKAVGKKAEAEAAREKKQVAFDFGENKKKAKPLPSKTAPKTIKTIESKWEKQDIKLDIFDSKNNIRINRIVVPKGRRGIGVGTKVINEIVAEADKFGKTITLSPSTDFGASSVTRLKSFYKRFGFVENKGRNKDYTISETMYREPVIKKEEVQKKEPKTAKELYSQVQERAKANKEIKNKIPEKDIRDIVVKGGRPEATKNQLLTESNAKKDKDFLNKWEKVYQAAKDATVSIRKVQSVFEKETGKKVSPEDNIEYKIDQVRGAGGAAKQFVSDYLEPVFKDIRKGRKSGEIGKISRELEDYLIAKRQKWLYKNKDSYVDVGYDEDWADKTIERIESRKSKYSDLIKEKAPEVWEFNKKLKEIKKEYGVIDEEFEKMLKEPYYVPFYRDVEKENTVAGIAGQKFTTTSKGIKQIKGSTSGRTIRNIFQNMITAANETIANAARNDVFNTIIKLSENSEQVGEIIQKVPPKWRKAGTIEHRTEIDKILTPQLNKLISDLGGSQKVKIRTARKLGSYRPKTQEIMTMFGATEATKSHEIGHLIDEDIMPLKDMATKYPREMTAVADLRYSGEEVTSSFVKYVRRPDEKAAEFVSMYITDRAQLIKLAPNAVADFEVRIEKNDKLKQIKDFRPSRQQDIDKITEDNWIIDTSIPKDEDVISGFVEGKLQHYRVPHELATAVKNLHPEQIPAILRVLTIPTSILRRGAVGYNIDFFIPNAVRDQIGAAFNAKFYPVVDYLAGLKHYLAQDDIYKQYMRRGGAMDSPEAGVEQLAKSSKELIYGSKKGEFLDPHYWQNTGLAKKTVDLSKYMVSAPFKGIAKLGEASEMATRLGVLERGLKSGQSIQEAIHSARQATLDFQRFGTHGRVPNQIIPFINAAMEGVDRTARSAYKHPVRFGMAAFTYAIAPTIGLFLYNKDDDDYKNIGDREKENNYIIMKKDGEGGYWKIPKSHVVKMIANPLQILWERAEGTSTGKWQDVPSSVWSSASPVDNIGTIVPTGLKLLIEPIANYDFYWKNVIEPPYIKAVGEPGSRYKKSTSESLKVVGKALNISPIMMQHEINSLFSGVGKHSIFALDWALGKTGKLPPTEATSNKIPILRRFKGKAEGWSSEISQNVREIDKSISRIDKMSVKSLIKYNKYSKQEALNVYMENKKYKIKMLKKKADLLIAQGVSNKILKEIQEEITKTEKQQTLKEFNKKIKIKR